MKTIFLRSGKWLLLTPVLVCLVSLINLNLVKRLEGMVGRQGLATFLTEAVYGLFTTSGDNGPIEAGKANQATGQQTAGIDHPGTADGAAESLQEVDATSAILQNGTNREESGVTNTGYQGRPVAVAHFSGICGSSAPVSCDAASYSSMFAGFNGGLLYRERIADDIPWFPDFKFCKGITVNIVNLDPGFTVFTPGSRIFGIITHAIKENENIGSIHAEEKGRRS